MAAIHSRYVLMATILHDLVEVYEYDGNVAFLRDSHRFRFFIYSDSSLLVTVEKITRASQNAVAKLNQRALDTINSIVEEVDNEDECIGEGKDEDEELKEAINESLVIPHDEVQDLIAVDSGEDFQQIKVVAYDGHAIVETMDSSQQSGHAVHFKLVLWEGREQGTWWSQTLQCSAHLSSQQSLSGQFVDIQGNGEAAQDFDLQFVSHRVEWVDKSLYPLTPGRYTLQGITIAENSFVYECVVELNLEDNGVVSGTSRELPFAQECSLGGRWTRSTVNYLLQYEMHRTQHTYVYYGTSSLSGVYGTWQNSMMPVLTTSVDTPTRQAECGILAFQLVDAVRVWSEAYHSDYPASFQECVKLLLLASYRGHFVPTHLIRSIVVYCGYDWFPIDLQEVLSRNRTKLYQMISCSQLQ